MRLSPKQLLIGASALILLSFGLAFAIFQLTDKDDDAERVLACNAWDSAAEAAAKAQAIRLVTSGADAAVFLDLDVSKERRQELEGFLTGRTEAKDVRYENKAEAYRKFVILFSDQPQIIERTTAESLPESFRVVLTSADSFDAFHAAVVDRPGVSEVRDERNTSPNQVPSDGLLEEIRQQGYYVDASGKRIAIPKVCSS